MIMSREYSKQRILSVLSDNLKSPQPDVVASASIAEVLQMELTETRQVIKILHDNGSVVSDPDGYYSLITLEGLQWLQQRTCCRP